MALYGYALRLGAGISKNKQRGTQLLQQSKHATARPYCALRAIGMDEDANEAFRLLTKECDTSDPHVQYLLGLCYANGYGCTPDKANALQCYKRAGNHVGAMSNLATLLLNLEDCALADHHRGIALLRQAATQGFAYAQYDLGGWFQYGLHGVLEKDIAQAKHWYSLAIAQGHKTAVWATERLAYLL
eukprot:TRINITY_DN9793_c0_g3_i1.p1 TRINITY_DN9793_c0_g3~~TRINITY_DN9793_c0_g3_i1.p1  ORF type:complete len:201 (-),score=50.06 TRINITY_DN9793_c0_g3_i1:72-632(-)